MTESNLNLQTEAGSPATSSWKEALSETMSEAVTSSGDGADAGDNTAQDAAVAEEADAGDTPAGASGDDGGDSAGDGEQVESGATQAGKWDGKPESIPSEYKAYMDAAVSEAVKKRESEMSRGVNKILQERAELHGKLQEAYAYIQNQQQGIAPQQRQGSGPPRQPAESASPEEWDKYYDDRTAWTTQQTIASMIQQGALLTPGMVQPMQAQMQQAAAQNEQIARLQYIARLPGCTDEIMHRMADIAQKDENLYSLLLSDKGSETVFNIAKAQLEAEQKLAGVGSKVEENARRGAAAAGQAVSRPGGVRKEGERVGRPRESFRSVAERIEYEIDQARKA